MNMASIVLFVCIVIAFICSPGNANNANNAFIKVQSKTEHTGQYGQKSLLECVVHLGQSAADATILVVTWKKDEDEKPLLLFVNGKTTEQSRYSFAEPSWNNKNMNVSLLITNTAVEDEGSYTCQVMTDSGHDTAKTNLKVTAKYNKPTIKPSPEKITVNTDGALTCQTDGGYPEGKLRWFDGDNMEWTKSSKMSAKPTDRGLLRLSSTLTLLSGSIYSKYTCVVYNASGGREDEATFEIGDTQNQKGDDAERKASDSTSKIAAPIVVIGSLIVGLLIVLLLYRRRSQQARRQSTTPLMGGHQGVRTSDSDVEGGDEQEVERPCKDSQP